MEEYYFITFDTTTYAMQAEDYLKKNNFSVTIIPTPREVTRSCGLSIKINSEAAEEVKYIIKQEKIKAKALYHLRKENGTKNIDKIG